MKALPKRKGNCKLSRPRAARSLASMKALPKRKGNDLKKHSAAPDPAGLNESPSEKEGKFIFGVIVGFFVWCLNESPSEKEGKSGELICYD